MPVPLEESEETTKDKEESDQIYKGFKKILYDHEKRFRQIPFKYGSINTFLKKYVMLHYDYILGTELSHFSRLSYLRLMEFELTYGEELKERRVRRQRKKRMLEFIFCGKFYRSVVQMGGRDKSPSNKEEITYLRFENVNEIFSHERNSELHQQQFVTAYTGSQIIDKIRSQTDFLEEDYEENDDVEQSDPDDLSQSSNLDWGSDENDKFNNEMDYSTEELQEFIRDEPQYDIQFERRIYKLSFDESRLYPLNFIKKIDLFKSTFQKKIKPLVSSINKEMHTNWTLIKYSTEMDEEKLHRKI